LKGWDGREVFEQINILLKDENTTELRLMLKDVVLMEKYSKTSDNEDYVEIMPPSTPNSNKETQEMEEINIMMRKKMLMCSSINMPLLPVQK
jgi:hypothetical protein